MPGKRGIVTFLLVIDFRFVYSVKLSRETVDAEGPWKSYTRCFWGSGQRGWCSAGTAGCPGSPGKRQWLLCFPLKKPCVLLGRPGDLSLALMWVIITLAQVSSSENEAQLKYCFGSTPWLLKYKQVVIIVTKENQRRLGLVLLGLCGSWSDLWFDMVILLPRHEHSYYLRHFEREQKSNLYG